MIILVLATIVLALLLVWPYITAVLTSIILAYIFYPVYHWLNKKIKRENVSSFIVAILIILLISLPLGFILFEVAKEANVNYVILKQEIMSGTLLNFPCEKGIICAGVNKLKEITSQLDVRYYLENSLKKATTYIAEGAFNFIFSIPKRLIDIFLTLFILFFLFRDGETILKSIEKATPLKKTQKDKIFKKMHEVTKGIVYGFFVIAIIESIIGAITFKLFGVTSPIMWGIVMGILALAPGIGPTLVWVPAVIIKFLDGSSGAAIGIIIGGIIISVIDTFLKPKVIGDRSNIHPIIMILGMLGGISLLGFIGVIVGPLILSLLVVFITMYKKTEEEQI